eukprot:s820_g13.t1
MEKHFSVVCLALALVWKLASAESCSNAVTNDEEVLPEASFLQVNQNITQTSYLQLNQSLTKPLPDASQAAVLHALRPADPSEVMSLAFMESYVRSERSMSFGSVFLDIAIIVLVVFLIFTCCSAFLKPSPTRAQSDPFLVEKSGAAAELLTSRAVPLPVLCSEFVMSSEARFTIDMAHITNAVQSFPINLPTGKKILEATVQQGGIISITDVQQTNHMMLRASAAGGRQLLTIMDGTGAYFGKDRRAVIARSIKREDKRGGEELRIQVSPQHDAVLMLGCAGHQLLPPLLLSSVASPVGPDSAAVMNAVCAAAQAAASAAAARGAGEASGFGFCPRGASAGAAAAAVLPVAAAGSFPLAPADTAEGPRTPPRQRPGKVDRESKSPTILSLASALTSVQTPPPLEPRKRAPSRLNIAAHLAEAPSKPSALPQLRADAPSFVPGAEVC